MKTCKFVVDWEAKKECNKPAKWMIHFSPVPDDGTYCCEDHILVELESLTYGLVEKIKDVETRANLLPT